MSQRHEPKFQKADAPYHWGWIRQQNSLEWCAIYECARFSSDIPKDRPWYCLGYIDIAVDLEANQWCVEHCRGKWNAAEDPEQVVYFQFENDLDAAKFVLVHTVTEAPEFDPDDYL